jgi:hypothetical protein
VEIWEWLIQAKAFYSNALKDEDLITELSIENGTDEFFFDSVYIFIKIDSPMVLKPLPLCKPTGDHRKSIPVFSKR